MDMMFTRMQSFDRVHENTTSGTSTDVAVYVQANYNNLDGQYYIQNNMVVATTFMALSKNYKYNPNAAIIKIDVDGKIPIMWAGREIGFVHGLKLETVRVKPLC